MDLELQFKLKSNPLYIKYLREHSYWYKILIRNPSKFKEFVENYKIDNKLRTQDKIEKVAEMIDVVSNLFSNML